MSDSIDLRNRIIEVTPRNIIIGVESIRHATIKMDSAKKAPPSATP
jgi:hypothetical protein